ncbi:MAG: hypothetical protein LLG04_12965 [Parachlamydia sp.]|nr:hypothetical protein [Parachlamydia sp.]
MQSVTALSVLTSIRDHGLEPRGAGRGCIAGENDPASSGHVCCNYFHPNLPDHPQAKSFAGIRHQAAGEARVANQLHNLVFNETTGMYPVAMEKFPGNVFATDAEYLMELARRVQNSVCLILHKDATGQKEAFPKFRYGNAPEYRDVATHQEIRFQGTIPSKEIQCVLAPLHLVALAKQVFGNKVIPVTDCQAEIDLGCMHDKAPMMRFYGQEGRVSLIAPDYVKGLKALGSLLNDGFVTHVVRLPSVPELHKQEGEKKFLLKIALNQQERIFEIAVSPLFQISKCCDPNEIKYHVVCKEGDVETLNKNFNEDR